MPLDSASDWLLNMGGVMWKRLEVGFVLGWGDKFLEECTLMITCLRYFRFFIYWVADYSMTTILYNCWPFC